MKSIAFGVQFSFICSKTIDNNMTETIGTYSGVIVKHASKVQVTKTKTKMTNKQCCQK